jgi:hypothetical protein
VEESLALVDKVIEKYEHEVHPLHDAIRGSLRSGISVTMDDQTLRVATAACAIWGAGVSTLLGLVKIWETFWKDRLRLEATHSFIDPCEKADEITVVNLSGLPVQVSHWTLAWKPNPFRWRTSEIDVTPEPECVGRFTIPSKGNYTLYFEEDAKFDSSYRTARHRNLYLTLNIFGRRQPKVLKVGAGQ